MRIGIDAACWQNKRGYGRFTRELLTSLVALDHSNQYVFFIDAPSARECQLPQGAEVVVVPTSTVAGNAASSSGNRPIGDLIRMTRAVSRTHLDLFFYPSVYSYFPLVSGARKIVAIHDVIAERFPRLIFPNSMRRALWGVKVWMALKQADLVLTVSEHSKRGIEDVLRWKSDKTRVVLEAADAVFQPSGGGEAHHVALARYFLRPGDRYFLYVGGFGPHKNLEGLVRGFGMFCRQRPQLAHRLVMVGDFENDPFWTDTSVLELARTVAPEGRITFPGFVPDPDLVNLYSSADALVMASFDEGFGLPALEAMACGTPVIGSRTTSLPEVVRDAGLFFDPRDSAELALCLDTIAADDVLRSTLRAKAVEVARTYSWERSARRLLEVFEEVAAT